MADVVGYSRLMSDDEESTLGDLKALHESARSIIKENGGRIVDLAGDSILAEFPSVVGAVRSAVSLRETTPSDAARPPSRRLQVRVGVHQAEITQDAERLYGDGINVAARLQALADPGGVAISGRVYEDIYGKLELDWVDTGERSLKNIARPVRVYKLEAAALPDRSPLDLPAKPSIAVLPFQNMSGDPEQEYFADGMVEDITTALSRLRWLFVVARNSSFTYKGHSIDVKQVGRELGVRYVLEGSVRKAGTRLRITAQLIEASTAIHVWADRFDGDLVDVFELQDQVASRVVGSIGHHLERAEIQRVIREPTQNLDAYDCYLRGMACFYGFSRSTNKQALAMFESAIRLDPDYASAFGMAARCYIQRRGFGWVEDPAHELEETIRLSVRAAELGREDAVALSAAGAANIIVIGDLENGLDLLRRGLALDPNLAWGWHFRSFGNAFAGEPEQAIEQATLSIRLSPQDPHTFAMHFAMALGHFFARRFDDAAKWAESGLRTQPRFFVGACAAAASFAMAGRSREADVAMRKVLEINPGLNLSNLRGLVTIKKDDDAALWTEGLRKAGLPD